jgi:hypothetical protein
MFGPLNGVRVVLVAGAVLAALVGFITGHPLVGWVLLTGVAIHGWGWFYLYRHRADPD